MKKVLVLICLAMFLACEFISDENKDNGTLPLGLFLTRSKIFVSRVDSQGFQTNWIDTASLFIRISENGKWERFDMIRDTCIYWRSLSDYVLLKDTVYLTKNHGINYKTNSKGCHEIDYEYDRDTTLKTAIKGFSNDYIEVMGEELYSEKMFRYLSVVDSF